MEYIQLNSDNTFKCEVSTYRNTEWDDNHLCTPQALTEEEATLFKVVLVSPTDAPTFNEITEYCTRDGVEEVNGIWQYKWKIETIPPAPVVIPMEVTQRQAKEELIDIDLIDSIEAFLNAIPDPKQKRIGLNWYNNSQVFMRNNQFLNYVWNYLGKTQVELDTMFINAAKR